jgi:hypothetical protein
MVPLFPYLAVRYAVGNIPTTVVNARTNVVGALAEDDYLTTILTESAAVGPLGVR